VEQFAARGRLAGERAHIRSFRCGQRRLDLVEPPCGSRQQHMTTPKADQGKE
jgi:hypothetical protein